MRIPAVNPSDGWNKARNTDRWTEILFRALTSRVARRWRFVSFRGTSGGESRGIVDVVAIRKDTAVSRQRLLRSGDLFDIVLVQMKGGSARLPSDADVRRLVSVAQRYRAKNIVLFAWKRAQRCQFYRLTSKRTWTESSASEIFG